MRLIQSQLILYFLYNLNSISSQTNNSKPSEVPADYACRPIGPCEPCPTEDLSSPVCQVYHNRRMVHCLYLGSSSPALVASILRAPGTYPAGLMSRSIGSSTDPPSDHSLVTRDSTTDDDDDDSHQAGVGSGSSGAEFPTWEACQRVVAKERADFYEFVLSNVILTLISLAVYTLRTKKLIQQQYRKLANRIGLTPLISNP